MQKISLSIEGGKTRKRSQCMQRKEHIHKKKIEHHYFEHAPRKLKEIKNNLNRICVNLMFY